MRSHPTKKMTSTHARCGCSGGLLIYMSQMLYAGQSARPSVPFLSDFQSLYRAQFMCQCCEILAHERQPTCNLFDQILWSWVVLSLIYGRLNFCHKFYSMTSVWLRPLSKIYGKSLSGHKTGPGPPRTMKFGHIGYRQAVSHVLKFHSTST